MNQTIVKFTACAQGAAAVAFKKAKSLVKNPRVAMVAAFLLVFTVSTFAQNTEAGIKAITTSTDSLKKYVPVVTNLCYALAGIVAIIGAICLHQDEQRGAGCQEEYHDDRWCLYLPHRRCTEFAIVLRFVIVGYGRRKG